MSERVLLQSFGNSRQVYEVNGVRYIVSSRFQPLKPKEKKVTLKTRVGEYLQSELAELMPTDNDVTIMQECVSTAGKED